MFFYLENAFDGVSWKVYDTEMMKNGMPEVLVRSVMSLYEGAKTRVRVDCELLDVFAGKVGMYR